MRKLSIKSLFILILLPLTINCAKAEVEKSVQSGSETVIGGVPFVKQKYRFCGPAALTSVMRFYGRDADQDEIASEVYTPELKGSLISDMKFYAQEKGFQAVTQSGSIDMVELLIKQKTPVILLIDKGRLGLKVQHYYVVYGYNSAERSFIIHDGSKSGRKIGYDKLDGEWKKMNRLMLVINNEN